MKTGLGIRECAASQLLLAAGESAESILIGIAAPETGAARIEGFAQRERALENVLGLGHLLRQIFEVDNSGLGLLEQRHC